MPEIQLPLLPTNWQRTSRRAFAATFREAGEFLRPRVVRKPSQWAVEVRKIPPGTSPLSGHGEIPYTHDYFPHGIEAMDAADDPNIRRIVLWLPIRDGKTTDICCSIIGRTVTDDPGNIYSVHPTDDNAAAFSIGDLEPMIESCLDNYFVQKKSRDSGRTIEFKKFAGGWIRCFSAGSLSKMRGTSVRVLLLHELDALDPEAIFKAFGRTTGFSDAIVVLESTGTDAATFDADGKKIYHSNIEEAYDQGDKRKWFCRCKRCAALQWLKYEQIKWEPGKIQWAKYHCEQCDYGHSEKEWRKMAKDGRWFPTAGLNEEEEREIEKNWRRAKALDPTVRSYWRNGFNSLLPTGKGFRSKLHQFAVEGDEAKRTPERFKVWNNEINAKLNSLIEDEEPAPDWKPIFDAREDYCEHGPTIPKEGLFLVAGADLQQNRIEIFWRAFGRGLESWAIKHSVVEGHYSEISTWEGLAAALAVKIPHALGTMMLPTTVFIDAGKWWDWIARLFFGDVYRRAENQWMRGHVRASKGVGIHNARIIHKRWGTIGSQPGDQKERRANLSGTLIGTWTAKDWIYDSLKGNGDARMHYPKTLDRRFFEQLTVETMIPKIMKGVTWRTYDNPKSLRNEALDLEVLCRAAIDLYPRDWDGAEQKLKQDAERIAALKPGIKEPPRPQIQPPRRNPVLSRVRGPF